GSIAHLPRYGLPDITEVYRDIPDSIAKLRGAISEAMELYEPRLRRIRVIHQDTDKDSMRLEFIVSAELTNRQPVKFQTTFSSSDHARVRRSIRQS
ncbi:MAG: type VI secretion system baseplate subunit TssE, partial [Bacteroidota bacterium]